MHKLSIEHFNEYWHQHRHDLLVAQQALKALAKRVKDETGAVFKVTLMLPEVTEDEVVEVRILIVHYILCGSVSNYMMI